MPAKTRITAYANSFKLIVDSRLSPDARSQRVRTYAQIEIAKADEINRAALGAVPPKTVTVNGRQDDTLSSIDPNGGIIIAEWRLVGEVLQFIYATLRARSPRLKGDYIEGHTLYADGTECDADNPPLANEYVFLNLVPYSRKIEIATVKGPPPRESFVIQVPNRIYERTADDASKRFGNIAKIRFTYQSTIGGSKGSADRTPAIVVTIK